MQLFNTRGWTLLESMLVVGIIGIVMSIGFLSYGKFVTEARKDEFSEEIVSVLREAKKKTLARENGFAYGVHLEQNSFTLFRAPAYIENDPENELHSVPANFQIASISLAGGGDEVVFLPLNGETNTHGSFVIEHNTGLTTPVTIRIYETGVIDID